MPEEKTQVEESELDENTAGTLFAELTQGYREWEYDGKNYRTLFATPGEEKTARRTYAKAFNWALQEEIPTQAEMRKILMKRGVWTEEEEKEMSGLREGIGKLEALLAKKSPKDSSKTTKKLVAGLLEKRSELVGLNATLGEYMNQTVESIAEEEKTAVLISSCTVVVTGEDKDGQALTEHVWGTPDEFLNEKRIGLLNTATYQYMTFTNGVAENYIEDFPEVKFLRAGQEDALEEAVKE